MNTLTNEEVSRLTDLQKAFLTLIIEKKTGKRYDLVHVKKAYISKYINEVDESLTKKGIQQLKSITKKLKL